MAIVPARLWRYKMFYGSLAFYFCHHSFLVVRIIFNPIWLFPFAHTPFWWGETLSWLMGLFPLSLSLLFGGAKGVCSP
jgi:hypothetical protein